MRNARLLLVLLAMMHTVLWSRDSVTIDQTLYDLIEGYYLNNQFSGVVLVSDEGDILFHEAFGYADLEKQQLNQLDSKFLIGSATKSFTAIAILQCVERNLVDLHTPIRQYISELTSEVGDLTLHQLMKNASGLPVHLNRITTLEYRDITSAELLDLYNHIELSFIPGSKFEYSNLNYQLCALVLERVTNHDYRIYLKEKIFEPLGMSRIGVERTNDHIPNMASGYNNENGELVKAQKNYLAFAKGGGDIFSTAYDLLVWDQGLYSGKLLTSSSVNLLFDGRPDQYSGYGYGFKVKPYNRNEGNVGKLVRHGGSMFGYICNIHRYLDDRVTIIVLGNMRPYPTMEITNKIEQVLQEYHYFE